MLSNMDTSIYIIYSLRNGDCEAHNKNCQHRLYSISFFPHGTTTNQRLQKIEISSISPSASKPVFCEELTFLRSADFFPPSRKANINSLKVCSCWRVGQDIFIKTGFSPFFFILTYGDCGGNFRP